jgi:hypothetical protein
MKKFLLLLFVLTISMSDTYGQLYQGPASGSVSSGVSVSTGQFVTDDVGNQLPLSVRRKLRNTIPFIPYPDYMNNVPPTKPDGPEKLNVLERGGNAPLLLESYQGSLDPGTFIPPDFDVAVGPNHVITIDNGRFRIWDKSGNLLKTIITDTWFASTFPGVSSFDPKIKYDHFSNRWVMVLLHQSDSPPVGRFLISVSDDADPIGTWYNWSTPSDVYGSSPNGSWGDYQGVGFDDEAIYLTSNNFNFGSNYQGSRIRIYSKAQLYANNNGPLGWTDLWDVRIQSGGAAAFGIRPAIVYGNPSEFYFITSSPFGSGTAVYVHKLINPTTTPSMTAVTIPVASYFSPPNANQQGGGTPLIDGGGFNFRHEPTFRNGFLWGVHAVADGTGYSNVRYLKLDMNTNTAVEDYRFGDAQHYHTYPALGVDEDMNLIFTFSRSANNQYMGAYYASRLNTDPPNTMDITRVLQPGKANYVKTFGDTRNRWGDYNGAFVDPVDQNNVWLFTEYAETPANTWAGWVGNVRLVPFSGPTIYTSSDSSYFGVYQVNTVSDTLSFTMYNYGDAQLNISNVQTSNPEFEITQVSSFPINLGYQDSSIVKVVFKPTSPGDKVANLTITSNDGTNPTKNITLAGKGFIIAPTTAQTLYGIAGPSNGGNLYTLNSSNGTASSVGATGYPQLSGLSVQPSTNQLFATIAGSPTTQLLRVNAAGGDAYPYSNIPIDNVRGIAFDLNGDMFCMSVSGRLYKYNVSNGDTAFIGNTGITNMYGISINPVTSQLWGVSLLGTLYKIDKSNASVTNIGPLNSGIIADICFDKDGKLYGLSGLAAQNSNLLSVDTSTGAATVIGATGIQGINGLAISPGVVGIEPVSNIIPEKYELYQNYPNPFNPVTNIKFDLPGSSRVKLVIYNSIGQKVAELFNGELSAGTYKYSWDAGNFASGIYFYRIESDNFVATKKLVLLK